MITETKHDDTFPLGQIYLEEFAVLRFDRNRNGGGVTIYVREDKPNTILEKRI